jgi:flagellin
MTVINTNIKALYTQGALKISQRESRVAMQQLSTGKRINSAKDDAAGLAIAARMTQNIQSLNQSVRNAGDAIVFIQTAEGATNDITTMLQRMSELAVQAANATYSPEQRGYLDNEFQQLKQEIIRIADTHEWNGFPILNGKAGTPVGAPSVSSTNREVVSAGATAKTLTAGDMRIKNNVTGVTVDIPASMASSDTVSNMAANASSKSGSAIAIAAAINSQMVTTGVEAKANGAVIIGTKTTLRDTSIQTNLYINGTAIPISLSSGQTEIERRQSVMNAINAETAIHGVKAGDEGYGGLTLTTVDGRNLSVWFDNSNGLKGSDFGLGLNTSRPEDVPPGVTGLTAQEASAATRATSDLTFGTLTAGQSVTVNGLTYTSTNGNTADEVAAAFANLSSGMTAVDAALGNPTSAAKGSFSGTFAPGFTTGASDSANVTATATIGNMGNVGSIVPSSRAPDVVTTDGTVSSIETSVLTFKPLSSGQSVTVGGLKFTSSGDLTANQVASAFALLNAGDLAADLSSSFGTFSGTFTSDFTTGSVVGDTVTASGVSNGPVTDIDVSSDTLTVTENMTPGVSVAASTVYGTVTLQSKDSFTVSPGFNADQNDPSYQNLSDLGFKLMAGNPVEQRNIGRLSFQVGPSPDQIISIDMEDYGPSGKITNMITGGNANVNTVESANSVITNVNSALDAVAKSRSTMGAVMNRLQHVVDNLTNVSMNEEASRSQIEDADYAAASTELARTQIMQQAATAVLAQANTDMQTVMKLLQ